MGTDANQPDPPDRGKNREGEDDSNRNNQN